MMISCRPFGPRYVLDYANRDLTVAAITSRPFGPPTRFGLRTLTTQTRPLPTSFPPPSLYDCRSNGNATLTQSHCNSAHGPGILMVPTICFANDVNRNAGSEGF